MEDIHREYMKKSCKDAMSINNELEEEYGFSMPQQMMGNVALTLFQVRISDFKKEWNEAMMQSDTDPNRGSY